MVPFGASSPVPRGGEEEDEEEDFPSADSWSSRARRAFSSKDVCSCAYRTKLKGTSSSSGGGGISPSSSVGGGGGTRSTPARTSASNELGSYTGKKKTQKMITTKDVKGELLIIYFPKKTKAR